MEIKIIKNKISLAEVKELALNNYGDMIKAVVDIEQKITALGGEFHADAEKLLLENGSRQADLWGINLYPEKNSAEFIEYNSLINIRPKAGNRKIDIEIPEIKEKIKTIINEIINYD